MKNSMKMLALVMWAGMVASNTMAVPVLGEVWGGLPGPAPNWSSADLIGSFPSPTGATVTELGTSVTLEFPTGGSTPYVSLKTADAAYQGSYAGLNGGFIQGLQIRFTLDPVDMAPNPVGGIALYFQSNGNIWYVNGVTTPLTTGAQTYTYAIGSAGNWTPEIGNLADWATAWADVDEIGFTVLGANAAVQQRYTFSDIEMFIQVPEPESVWMALIVLASLGITFRGRLSEMAGQVRARIKA